MLTKAHQAKILEKVKAGTGLVWIGQDKDVPALGFRLADRKAVAGGAPRPTGESFATVPFALLGSEPSYAIAEEGPVTVHARSGARAYLVESAQGKGRVFNLGYRALSDQPWPNGGLTPVGLRDFYESKAAPVEHYYSLLAKLLLAAGGKELPVRLGAADVSPSRASVCVSAAASGPAPKRRTVSRKENQNFSTLGTVTRPSLRAICRNASITAATSMSLGQRKLQVEQERHIQRERESRT